MRCRFLYSWIRMVLFLTTKKTEISPIWRFSRLRNPSSRTKTTGQLLAFGGGHLIWIWNNAYPTEVEAVGIETGVDGGIAGVVGGGVEITSGLEEVELLVGQVVQEGFP